MIDDMTVLREGWPDPEPPSAAAQSRARAALLARVAHTRVAHNGAAVAGVRPAPARDWPWSGRAWRRVVLAMAVAVAVVGGLALVGGLDQDGGSRTATPADLPSIELAAVHASAQPFTPPRPDQWTYLKFRMVNPGAIAQTKGMQTDVTSERWNSADGQRTADMDSGKLAVVNSGQYESDVFPPRDYETLAGLPAEPAQLLDWVREHTGAGEQHDADAFRAISTILRENLLPPAVTAALLRAVGLIPAVFESSDPIEVDGRAATVVGIVQEGWLESDILLDPQTHEFLGSRDLAVANHTFTIGPEGAQGGGTTTGDGPGAAPSGGSNDGATVAQVRKGELQSMLIRSAVRIVDAPGQTG